MIYLEHHAYQSEIRSARYAFRDLVIQGEKVAARMAMGSLRRLINEYEARKS